MTDSPRISVDELTDEQIERVLNSRGFQKMLAYQKLADGIEVLEEQDDIFSSMVENIRKQHRHVNSADSVREVLTLFVDEVKTFTEPLVDEDAVDGADLEDLYVGEGEEDSP